LEGSGGIVGEVVLEVPGDWRSGGQCTLTHRDEGFDVSWVQESAMRPLPEHRILGRDQEGACPLAEAYQDDLGACLSCRGL